MLIDEGGVPTGSLSEYVSRRVDDIARQKLEAERQVAAARDRKMDLYVQRTAPLRAHLQGLAAPLDELLSRFNAGGLLQDACNIYRAKAEEPENVLIVYPCFRDQRSEEYSVIEQKPRIYQQIVENLQLAESFQLENGIIDLETIVEPDNFRRLIPWLEGYGLALELSMIGSIYANARHEVWVKEESHYGGWSVGGGDRWSSTPAHWSWDEWRENVAATVTKAMTIEVVRAENGDGHDLMYSHQLKRTDLRNEKVKSPPQDVQRYLTSPIRIHASDSIEDLKEIIGDDISKDLDGRYLDLIHKFLRVPVTKTISNDVVYPF